ncbi:MAG TPA: hypothetical protein VNU68_35290 [Verrucomicrobiae bacterium]|nr:hypothetical protein [Verrucomicrobiae bacterium]
MPKYVVEMKEWVEYETSCEIEARDPTEARRLANDEADSWGRTGRVRDTTKIVRRAKD